MDERKYCKISCKVTMASSSEETPPIRGLYNASWSLNSCQVMTMHLREYNKEHQIKGTFPSSFPASSQSIFFLLPLVLTFFFFFNSSGFLTSCKNSFSMWKQSCGFHKTCWANLILQWLGRRSWSSAPFSQLGFMLSAPPIEAGTSQTSSCDLVNSTACSKPSQHKPQQISAASALRDGTAKQNQHRAGCRPEMDGRKISPFWLWETSNSAQLFRKPQLRYACDRCSS